MKVAVPLVAPAATVNEKSVTGAKSAASASPAPPLPSTDTVITVSDSKVLEPFGNEAVTCAVFAADPSPRPVCVPFTPVSASTLKAKEARASSSSMVTDPLLTVKPEAVPDTVSVSDPSA